MAVDSGCSAESRSSSLVESRQDAGQLWKVGQSERRCLELARSLLLARVSKVKLKASSARQVTSIRRLLRFDRKRRRLTIGFEESVFARQIELLS